MRDKFPIIGRVTVTIKRASTGQTEVICDKKKNILTNSGTDWIHGQVYSAGTTDEAKYVGVSSNSDVPSATDTVLAGEIASGGLSRAAGTVTHTAGTSSTTIVVTYTSSGTHTDVQKAGLFSAVSSGTLVHENTFTSVSVYPSDILIITWTISTSG